MMCCYLNVHFQGQRVKIRRRNSDTWSDWISQIEAEKFIKTHVQAVNEHRNSVARKEKQEMCYIQIKISADLAQFSVWRRDVEKGISA